MLIAACLPNLQFQPGLPVPGAETISSATQSGETNSTANDTIFPWLLQGALALIFILIFIVLIISLVKKNNIKQIVWLAAGLVILFTLFYLLNWTMPALPNSAAGIAPEAELPKIVNFNVAPIGEPPVKLFGLVMTALLLGAAILSIWLLYKALRRTRHEHPLAREASAALQAIADGDDLKNVIIHCYLQMIKIVQEEQGIEREESVTPREFENFLSARGIPVTPIHQITRLFEKVRYGNKAPDRQDELAAVECLSAIRVSCQTGRRGIK